MTATYPHHSTTIDQHKGEHEATGLPIYQLLTIVTELSDLSQDDWDAMDEEAREYWTRIIDEYHDARVELESLPAEIRAEAKEILLENGAEDADGCASAVRNAIARATGE